MPREEKRTDERRGISIDMGLSELFKGIGSITELVSGMVDLVDWSELDEETLAELRRTSQTRAGARPRGVYGVSVGRGMGGIPRVQPFGNIRRTERGPIIDEVREPLVDVFDEDDAVLVVAELPGVEENDIQIEIKGPTLKLSTTAKDRKYAKEIQLACAVDESKMESTYKNGVLEIKLPKIGSE